MSGTLPLCARDPAPKTRTQGLSCPKCSLPAQAPPSLRPGKCGWGVTGLLRTPGGVFTDMALWPQSTDSRAWRRARRGSTHSISLMCQRAIRWYRRKGISINRCSVNKNLLVTRNKARKLLHNLWLNYWTELLTDTPDDRGSNEHLSPPQPLYWWLLDLHRCSTIWGWGEGEKTRK